MSTVLTDRLVVHARGPIRLSVTPTSDTVLAQPASGLSGRELLDRASRAALTLARIRQFQTFLGNPDPTGRSRTTYTYRTAARPTTTVVAVTHEQRRGWVFTLAVVAGLVLAAAGALFVWSRS